MKYPQSKLLGLDDISGWLGYVRERGRSLVFTNGIFDLLHAGHLSLLFEAASLGDDLLVAINSDASARKLKGEGRPVIDEWTRGMMLSALEIVDRVVIFDEDTPEALIRQVSPRYLVKGDEYKGRDIAGLSWVSTHGGQIHYARRKFDISTTRLVGAGGHAR